MQLHSYLLRSKGAFIFIIIIIIIIIIILFFYIKRANSLFMLSDFYSQPATVLTFSYSSEISLSCELYNVYEHNRVNIWTLFS